MFVLVFFSFAICHRYDFDDIYYQKFPEEKNDKFNIFNDIFFWNNKQLLIATGKYLLLIDFTIMKLVHGQNNMIDLTLNDEQFNIYKQTFLDSNIYLRVCHVERLQDQRFQIFALDKTAVINSTFMIENSSISSSCIFTTDTKSKRYYERLSRFHAIGNEGQYVFTYPSIIQSSIKLADKDESISAETDAFMSLNDADLVYSFEINDEVHFLITESCLDYNLLSCFRLVKLSDPKTYDNTLLIKKITLSNDIYVDNRIRTTYKTKATEIVCAYFNEINMELVVLANIKGSIKDEQILLIYRMNKIQSMFDILRIICNNGTIIIIDSYNKISLEDKYTCSLVDIVLDYQYLYTLQTENEYFAQFIIIPSSNVESYTILFVYETGTLHKYYKNVDRLHTGEQIKGLDKIYKVALINDMVFIGTKDHLFKIPRFMCQFKKNCQQCLELDYNECVWDYSLNICNIKEFANANSNFKKSSECPKIYNSNQDVQNNCYLENLKSANQQILQIQNIITCGFLKENSFERSVKILYELQIKPLNAVEYIKTNTSNYLAGFFEIVRVNFNTKLNLTCSIKTLSNNNVNYTSTCSLILNATSTNNKYISNYQQIQSDEFALNTTSIQVNSNYQEEKLYINYKNKCYTMKYDVLVNSIQANITNCSSHLIDSEQRLLESKLNRASLIVSILGSFLFVSIFINFVLIIISIKTNRKLKKIRATKKSDRSLIRLLPQRIINTEI